ncbi:MAG: NusG domain II-containing protein [Eubacteriales bacterium]|nr:NusG domain II-containing protein [Eubacteriales bacterium]
MKTKLIKKADIIAAAVIIAAGLAAFLFLRGGEGRMAVVEYNGKTVKTIDLSEVEKEYTFTVNGDLDVEITVTPEGIRFSHSECRDKLCIKFGLLSQRGDMAACVPAKVSIRITGGTGGTVDGITG